MAAKKYDMIIVGAGPGGAACGNIAAQIGLKPLILERAQVPGQKNHSGMAIFPGFMKEILGQDFPKNSPMEDYEKFVMFVCALGPKDSYSFYQNKDLTTFLWTVYRNEWDKWFAEQAVKSGADLRTSVLVKNVIKNKGKVVGVVTDTGEEIFAPITVAADGTNSMLCRAAGLRPKYPRDCALFVSHVFDFPEGFMDKKYGKDVRPGGYFMSAGFLDAEECGFGYLWCHSMHNQMVLGGGGFLQPGGVNAAVTPLNPNYTMQKLLQHPKVQEWTDGGTWKYYCSHIDPAIAYLGCFGDTYMDGMMSIGDAGVGSGILGFGSMNATQTGKFAAETAKRALEKGDVSAASLKEYQDTWKKEKWVVDAATEPYLYAKLATEDGLGPILNAMSDIYGKYIYNWYPGHGVMDGLGDLMRDFSQYGPNLFNMLPGLMPMFKSAVGPLAQMASLLGGEK